MTRPSVEVVAAVITRPDGSYLLAQRPPGKVYAGYWEFPGGKIEPGETAQDAIVREIREELGIEVLEATPWFTRRHDYEHAAVRLRFFRVTCWQGEPVGLEGQRFEFQIPGAETVAPMLPANGPILRAVSLPPVYGITFADELSPDTFLSRLDIALTRGLRLVQLREKSMRASALPEFAAAVAKRCHAHGARLMVNSDLELARSVAADGVHLTARQLLHIASRPHFGLVAASTHDATELARAAAIGCDFAVLGPVLPTASHPGHPGLGWGKFAALAGGAELPVFALGGLGGSDAHEAMRNGAHGVALMRAAWLA